MAATAMSHPRRPAAARLSLCFFREDGGQIVDLAGKSEVERIAVHLRSEHIQARILPSVRLHNFGFRSDR